MKFSKSTVLLVFLLAFSCGYPHSLVMGQGVSPNCVTKLKMAQRAYDEGELQLVVSLIEPCLPNYKFANAITAYRLMVLANIFLDKPNEADRFYKKLLNQDPNYQPNPDTDPIELVQLHQSFRTAPLFSAGVVFGGRSSNPVFQGDGEAYRIDGLRALAVDGGSKFGVNLGVTGEWYPSSNFSIVLGANYISSKFDLTEGILINNAISVEETQSMFSFPVGFRYYFGSANKLRIFGELGGGVNILTASNFSIERTVEDGKDVTGPQENVLSLRNKTNFMGQFAIGIRRSFGKTLLFGKLGASYDIFNQNDPDNRYNNENLLFKYGYVDQDFKLLTPFATVGLSYAIYPHNRIEPRISKK